MGFLSKLLGREDAAVTDARRIYTALMAQSRKAAFYGHSRFADDYDGRIDVLTLHIAAVLSNLNRFGQNGERLGQALFDEMKDDFEVALREEALSDASVKKRIQPMISLFYARAKTYAEALHQENPNESVRAAFRDTLSAKADQDFISNMSTYLLGFNSNMLDLTLGEIAMTQFDCPALPA